MENKFNNAALFGSFPTRDEAEKWAMRLRGKALIVTCFPPFSKETMNAPAATFLVLQDSGVNSLKQALERP